MVNTNSSEASTEVQPTPGLLDVQHILEAIDSTALIDRLWAYRRTGRPGYPPQSLWRAYVASFILNLSSTNELIRRLEDDIELRLLCGFSTLPGRRTFNRFILRLSDHTDLVEELMGQVIRMLADELPDFGKVVAVDSTAVKAYSNGNREPPSDPDATWAPKHSAGSKGGEEKFFGYKYHGLADLVYDVPITGYVTTGATNDVNELLPLIDKAEKEHSWFNPKNVRYVVADRGYEAHNNSKGLVLRGYSPIIRVRDVLKSKKNPKSRLYYGLYTYKGVPTCDAMAPMQYVKSDRKRGHLYRCVNESCQLKNRKGACQDIWVNVLDNPLRFPPVRLDSQRWKDIYAKRQGIERVFKSLKQSRRLEAHNVRGKQRIALHAAMSVLVFQLTVLTNHRDGRTDHLRWQVRAIA